MITIGGRVGIIWDTPVMFSRLVEECGYIPELVTPHFLAAPFFRRSFSAIIIPGGFANPSYSSVLPALRACEDRIRRFVTSGGTVLAFGAGIDKPDAYDWLPVRVRYRFGFSEGVAEGDDNQVLPCITDCPDTVLIDGVFELPDPVSSGTDDAPGSGEGVDLKILLYLGGFPIQFEYSAGAGRIILTTLHEYPSRGFLQSFCIRSGETLL